MRIRFSDRKIETIASLKDLRMVNDPLGGGSEPGVTPDGSVLFTRDTGSQEIYSLKLKWP